jgi:protein subunit release factor A
MKKNYFSLIPALLLLIFGLFACGNKDAEQAKKLEEDASKIHDEVMPITFKIRDLRDSVLKKAEAIKDSTRKDLGVTVANEIQDADNSMDEFMNKLGDAMNSEDNDEAKIKIFTELKTEGEAVKKKTLDAKYKAEEYLKK